MSTTASTRNAVRRSSSVATRSSTARSSATSSPNSAVPSAGWSSTFWTCSECWAAALIIWTLPTWTVWGPTPGLGSRTLGSTSTTPTKAGSLASWSTWSPPTAGRSSATSSEGQRQLAHADAAPLQEHAGGLPADLEDEDGEPRRVLAGPLPAVCRRDSPGPRRQLGQRRRPGLSARGLLQLFCEATSAALHHWGFLANGLGSVGPDDLHGGRGGQVFDLANARLAECNLGHPTTSVCLNRHVSRMLSSTDDNLSHLLSAIANAIARRSATRQTICRSVSTRSLALGASTVSIPKPVSPVQIAAEMNVW